MIKETFVYDGIEVEKTGRIAERKISSRPGTADNHILYEVKPVDKDLDWKKWVDQKMLYKVKQLNVIGE